MERLKKKEVLKQKRETLHLPRRCYHFVNGLICFSIYQWMVDRNGALMLIVGLGGSFAILDFLRLRIPKLNTAALKLFGSIMRREELLRITANTWFIFALFLLVVFFPKPIALLALLYLAAGDPLAAVIGTRWGRHPLVAGKTWEGTLANFIISAIATALYSFFILDLNGVALMVLTFLGGFISAVSELIPLPANDNLTFPLLAASLLTLANYFLAFF